MYPVLKASRRVVFLVDFPLSGFDTQVLEMSAATQAPVGGVPSTVEVQADQKSSLEKEIIASEAIANDNDSDSGRTIVPLSYKIASILLVSAIGFGSKWSSGITGAMKTTIKKVRFAV